MFRLLDWIRRLDPDVLHIDDVDVSSRLAPALAVTRLPCPVVVGCHDPEPHAGESNWRVQRLIRPLMFLRADACLVHHNAGLRRTPPPPAPSSAGTRGAPWKLRLPAAPQRLAVPYRPAVPVVLLFGRISAYKGLDVCSERRRPWPVQCRT